jgi:hypothetical protein
MITMRRIFRVKYPDVSISGYSVFGYPEGSTIFIMKKPPKN